jgi:hypothetical protein
MIENFAVSNTGNVLTFVNPSGKTVSMKIGTVVKAEVMEAIDSGMVALRVIPPVGKSEDMQGLIIRARSEVPMSKGQTVFLEVLSGGKTIKLRLVGVSKGMAETSADNDSTAILKLLSGLSGSRLSSKDFKLITDMFKSLPESIKEAFPEFKAIEKLLPQIQNLNGRVLKMAAEGSGLMFESRLKFAALEGLAAASKSGLQGIFMSGVDKDLKALLLKIKDKLKNQKILKALKHEGFRHAEVAEAVSRLIRNIEFFQLTSKLNEILYMFLPVSWEELNDGELSFRKNTDGKKESYTCDINLDLEPFGRLSVSVTMFDGAFYVTFLAEKADTAELINSERENLQKRFEAQGLPLKIVNISQRQEIIFGGKPQQGVDLKV